MSVAIISFGVKEDKARRMVSLPPGTDPDDVYCKEFDITVLSYNGHIEQIQGVVDRLPARALRAKWLYLVTSEVSSEVLDELQQASDRCHRGRLPVKVIVARTPHLRHARRRPRRRLTDQLVVAAS